MLQMEQILLCKTHILKAPHQTCSSPTLALTLQSTLQPYVLAQARFEWHRQEMSISDLQPVQTELAFLDAGGGLGRVVKRIILGV